MFKILSIHLLTVLVAILLNKPIIAMTGKDISEKVTEWLTLEGVNGKPVFSNTSVYKDCNNNLEIKKIYNDYKTVKVNCSDKNGYQLLIRVKILSKKPKNKLKLDTKIKQNKIFEKKKVKVEKRIFKAFRLKKSLEKNAIIDYHDIELVETYNNSQKSFFFFF